MSSITEALEEVESLLHHVRPAEAEQRLLALLSSISEAELPVWEEDLRLTIAEFLPKRRRLLTTTLDNLLRSDAPPASSPASSEPLPSAPRGHQDDDALLLKLTSQLQELSDHHIFQWSTFYRDSLVGLFDRAVDVSANPSAADAFLSSYADRLAHHSREIFSKGFAHISGVAPRGTRNEHAIAKSLSGLQRFLDIPIEFYSTYLARRPEPTVARATRAVSSGMLSGILLGYSRVQFGTQSGAQILSRFPRTWSYALCFLRSHDLERLLPDLPTSDQTNGLKVAVTALASALDNLNAAAQDYVPLPTLAQLVWPVRRLEVSIPPPALSPDPQLIDLHLYLDPAFFERRDIDQSVNRDVGLVLAPLRPDLERAIRTSERHRRVVVSTEGSDLPGLIQQATAALEYSIYRRRSPRVAQTPLRYNFARDFPLHNPSLTRYFHVHRSSVRELLRTFERRNGVRLWCSVRRSGKTTACLELGATTGRSMTISQTCDSTGQSLTEGIFYEAVTEAVEVGRQLPAQFFADTLADCALKGEASGERVVFLLDEYETLFGRLSAALRQDPDLRYLVVQPLLNQMVAFSRENLIVFLGQQPNAHFILMDQNQLSAYVEQDAFPLFRPGTTPLHGEFADLVRRVLTDRVGFDAPFLDALYEETSGHPYLTVNLLVEVVEWLIDQERSLAGLSLTARDVEAFRRERLKPSVVSVSPEYRFFREAVSEATGTYGRRSAPWLYAVYSCLRELALSSPRSLACTHKEFQVIAERCGVQELGLTHDAVLSTGAYANFFEVGARRIRPKIRLLARIAAVSPGRLES